MGRVRAEGRKGCSIRHAGFRGGPCLDSDRLAGDRSCRPSVRLKPLARQGAIRHGVRVDDGGHGGLAAAHQVMEMVLQHNLSSASSLHWCSVPSSFAFRHQHLLVHGYKASVRCRCRRSAGQRDARSLFAWVLARRDPVDSEAVVCLRVVRRCCVKVMSDVLPTSRVYNHVDHVRGEKQLRNVANDAEIYFHGATPRRVCNARAAVTFVTNTRTKRNGSDVAIC